MAKKTDGQKVLGFPEKNPVILCYNVSLLVYLILLSRHFGSTKRLIRLSVIMLSGVHCNRK